MSSVRLKSAPEIDAIRRSGRMVAEILAELSEKVEPGITTLELDRLARRRIDERRARPSFLGYRGFPASICCSVNDAVVHGIPSEAVRLQEGDIVSIDLGVLYEGFHADAAVTVPVGAVSATAQRLLGTTRRALEAGIEKARPGNRLHDVSSAIQACAEADALSVVRDYTGHGIGRNLHEAPEVPNRGKAGTGLWLTPGLVFCIEPMCNAGTWKTRVQADKWTVTTADGSLSCHFEHTVAVTEAGPVVLTAL